MHTLYTEQRLANGKHSLAWDLAHHLYLRSERDRVIVATDKPAELLSETHKQWLKLMRQVMRQRSNALNAVRFGELAHQITYMQSLRFSARPPKNYLDSDITFATADDLIRVTPICRTAYITCEIEREKLYMLTSWMPEGSVVVIYAGSHSAKINCHGKGLEDGANARTANQKSYQAALR